MAGSAGDSPASSVDFRFVGRVRHIFLCDSSACRLVTINEYRELEVSGILIMTINIFPRGFYCSHGKNTNCRLKIATSDGILTGKRTDKLGHEEEREYKPHFFSF